MTAIEPTLQTIKAVSREAIRLAARIESMEIGATITYSELSEIAGSDVQRARRHWLERARKIAEAAAVPAFTESVSGIGLKRIPQAEVATIEKTSTVGRIRRATRRSGKRLSRVDYANLDQDAKRAHDVAATTMGVLAMFVDRKGQASIEQGAIQSGCQLDREATLELFRK
jgi:hypothetical protein